MAWLMAAAFLSDDAIGPRQLIESNWGRLTVIDAYLAILTVYWLTAFRERSVSSRLLWLVLYLGLGSFAIAVYMLLRYRGREAPLVESVE